MEAGCWLLGGEFEDSVFEERRERRPGPPASYRAKLCEPQWFYGETESSDDVEALTIKKFRGDLAYRRQEYQKALQEYSSISEKLSSTNVAMKRDVQEGMQKHWRLRRTWSVNSEEQRKIANDRLCQAARMDRLPAEHQTGSVSWKTQCDQEMKATNTDHLTTVLCLQLAICSSSQDVQRTTFCLQKLVSLHPFSPWTWGRLAEAYLAAGPALSAWAASSHRQSHSTSRDKAVTSACPHSGKDCHLCFPETLPESSVCSVETSSSKSPKKEEALKNFRDSLSLEARMKACASFIRTRLLLQLTQSQQTSFALERNLRTQQEIEDKMKGFGFKEDTVQLMTEVMGEDIVPEKIKDEVHSEVKCVGPAALAALVIASSEEFEDKWFRKIKDHFCSFEDQFHTQMQISA